MPATSEPYTLSLHDALPISFGAKTVAHHFLKRQLDIMVEEPVPQLHLHRRLGIVRHQRRRPRMRSEEHTSELQSQSNLVCRLLLEKKNNRCPSHLAANPSPT